MEIIKMFSEGQVRDFHALKSRKYEYNGRVVEIVATTITGIKPNDLTHEIKGEEQVKQVKHADLIKLYNSGKLKSINP